jgi:hypothetical protein
LRQRYLNPLISPLIKPPNTCGLRQAKIDR